MKKIITFLTVVITTITLSFAQKVEPAKIKHQQFGMKKTAKNMPKKIFLQHFFVNYQVVFDQEEIAKGGSLAGGGIRGKAKARLVLGIKGISEKDLQEVTDKLYKDYIEKLKAKGFEIITAEEASKFDIFKDWTISEGGKPSRSQFPGYVATAPSGFKYLVKKISKKGKEKRRKNIFDYGAGVSKELGVIVARVSINVPFMKDGESQGSRAFTKTIGGIAKVVGKPEFGILKSTTIMSKGIIGDKANTISTNSSFVYKKNLKLNASLQTFPAKKILINDVFEKKKYKAIETASQDVWGTNYGVIRVYSAKNSFLEKLQAVPCNPDKYKKGVLIAGTDFLNNSLNEFLKYF